MNLVMSPFALRHFGEVCNMKRWKLLNSSPLLLKDFTLLVSTMILLHVLLSIALMPLVPYLVRFIVCKNVSMIMEVCVATFHPFENVMTCGQSICLSRTFGDLEHIWLPAT